MRYLTWLAAAGVAMLVPAMLAGSAWAVVAPTGEILNEGTAEAIPGRYIVVLKDTAVAKSSVSTRAQTLAARHSGKVSHVYSAALNGFAIATSATEAHRLAADPAVAYVQQDSVYTTPDAVPTASTTQGSGFTTQGVDVTPPSWGLDAIDSRTRPGDGIYRYPNTASNVTAYIIDTGVRITHSGFGGRARYGVDFVENDTTADDCNGHGTHVAGTVAGAFGVARMARIVSVRVADCGGISFSSWILAGIDWVTAYAERPAVANMSISRRGFDTAVENAMIRSIGSGVTYSVAAGNQDEPACNFTPARVYRAITVAAFNPSYNRFSLSNYGPCVDIFAPGEQVISADWRSDTGRASRSGTSHAAPHVAGVAALWLQYNPRVTGAAVADQIVGNSTNNLIQLVSGGTPNLALYSGFIPAS